MKRVLHISRIIPQEMLGPMYLSRAVKDAGHDMKALFLPDHRWIDKVKEYKPDVVTWSIISGSQKPILELNRVLKSQMDFFSLLGGPHVTFVPEIAKEPGVDAVCVGEGEHVLVDLLNALDAGTDYKQVQNLSYSDGNGGLIKNPLRPLISDLDSLGFPDRELVYDAEPLYRDSLRKVVATQRGCPMMCSFCFHHVWKKKVYGATNREYVRKRSVSHVIAEVQEIRSKYPLRFVHFVDDIFNLRNDWLAEFSERWPKEVGLPFDVILMANMTKEDHIKQLKHAGCIYARIAFETANDYIRNEIYRKSTQRKHLTDAAEWIKKYGIRLGSLNMLGAPGGTIEDEFDSMRLNIESRVDHPLVSIVQPYPEFDFNEMTQGMGYAVSSYDDLPAKFNRQASIEVPHKQAIENLHKWFPIVVRFPRLMPLARLTMHSRALARPLLVLYMLFSEWLVTEQNVLYNKAQGARGFWTWGPVDFLSRVIKKGFLLAFATVGGKYVHKMAMRLQMGDERVVAHVD